MRHHSNQLHTKSRNHRPLYFRLVLAARSHLNLHSGQLHLYQSPPLNLYQCQPNLLPPNRQHQHQHHRNPRRLNKQVMSQAPTS